MKHIYHITGGQRSGKSSYAERLALSLSSNPVYMATAHIWDDEFRERVRRHQERRGPEWTNIEEERHLSHHDVSGRVVLIDCLTLWATNYLYPTASPSSPVVPPAYPSTPASSSTPALRPAVSPPGSESSPASPAPSASPASSAASPLPDIDAILPALCAEFDRFTSQDATFIFVTNEIGLGGTSPNALQRRFTDLLGWLNQYVASRADEVILMVSGLPITVKPLVKQQQFHKD